MNERVLITEPDWFYFTIEAGSPRKDGDVFKKRTAVRGQ